MLATRAGLFKRLSALEEKQRAAWVREWEPMQANINSLTEGEWDAAEDKTPFSPELEAWACEPIDALEPRLKAAMEQEEVWMEAVKPPRALSPSDEPECWNFDAPTYALKPYMPAEVCEAYREWVLLLEQYAPQSPDLEGLKLLAAKWRYRAKWARGYAGLRPWNDWDWKPQVSPTQSSGAPW